MRLELLGPNNVGMLFQLLKNPIHRLMAQTQPFFVFLLRTDETLFGWVSLQHITAEAAELGLSLLRPCGLFRVTKHISTVLDFAFTVLGLKEVTASTELNNSRAMRLLAQGRNKGGSRFVRLPDEGNRAMFAVKNTEFLGE